MKKFFVIAAALICAVAFVSASYAETTGETATANSHVFLTVNPTLGLRAIADRVSLGTVTTGDITPISGIGFTIHANSQEVAIGARITELFKADDPNNRTNVIPIDFTKGVKIDPDNANVIEGSNIAGYDGGTVEFTGDDDDSDGVFTAYTTSALTFQSSQTDAFSQDVYIYPHWNNSNNELPVGKYSGYVILYASLVDYDWTPEPV